MKGVIKNMKEQFLNLSGLTELVTYIKLCIIFLIRSERKCECEKGH